MALRSEKFKKALQSFRRKVLAVFVDEAHCISQWGGDFRKAYAELGSLCALVPPGIPFAALSATLKPKVHLDIMEKLGMLEKSTVFLDLGNERPNVALLTQRLQHPLSSFRDLDFVIPKDISSLDQIPKTIIYIDSVLSVTKAVVHLYGQLPELLWTSGPIQAVHAWMPSEHRTHTMSDFLNSGIRILVCTEAAGMVS